MLGESFQLLLSSVLQDHAIALLLASSDPHTVYDLVVNTQPHVIQVHKSGIVTAIPYLYPSGTLLEDLQRLSKALSKKLAKVDLDAPHPSPRHLHEGKLVCGALLLGPVLLDFGITGGSQGPSRRLAYLYHQKGCYRMCACGNYWCRLPHSQADGKPVVPDG
ncbi:hypothetical protein FFLO_04971 [Filobasidium floriforme]|uniref:Uncharacterized protein n=1 Tax=Filobasidium floriforme TaxID=5210 RepID=A0A8K0JJZ0_9TREE|nr:uncharacterized protein HD553DRAFT_345004 [Filobasidium floriforme]KAG7530545.1 hypothetical protein FFLO_04971 [Filobasidium floriforme]KAH8080094.1 hypothetical protein HD553DRAFT_345004 [Filobasidium floriforme]